MRKGISLPIELIIVIAISVIVLLAAVSFFFSGLLTGQKSISNAQAWSRGCDMIKNRGCILGVDLTAITIDGYDYNLDGTYDSIKDACIQSQGGGAGEPTDDECIINCCRQFGITPQESSRP